MRICAIIFFSKAFLPLRYADAAADIAYAFIAAADWW